MMRILSPILAALLALATASLANAEGPMIQTTHTYESFDGSEITYAELGTGPTVLLLHGFTANAELNWFGPGIAQQIAGAGYTVIAPDFRGHGQSQAPDGTQSWPVDALARDQIALIAHLGQTPHAIVGYSLGSITALRLHLLSRQGTRLVLGGVGDSVADEFNTDRNDAFRAGLLAEINGQGNAQTAPLRARAKATGGTLEGYLGALSSRTYTPADLLATFNVPTLVLTGNEDLDNGSGSALAELIPGARHEGLTGTHLTAVGDPEFSGKIIAFLGE